MAHSSLVAELEAGRRGAALYDRRAAPTVFLSGKDTLRFCNGMFSNNIRAMTVGQSNRNVMLDEKGRIQGQLEIWCVDPQGLLATLEGVSAAAFMERYDRFIIADDVELEDLSQSLQQLSLQGPQATSTLQKLGLPTPEAGFAAVDQFRIARRARCRASGFDLLLPAEQAPEIWEALRGAGAVVAGEETQEILRIEAGFARWPIDMGERALVHEMRMVPDYCSFEKGCYIGQEVINRIDVMGQVQKKIWGLELEGEQVPPVGTELRLGDTVVGTTCSAAREPSRVRLLALLRKAAWQPGLVLNLGEQGATAKVRDLPFPD